MKQAGLLDVLDCFETLQTHGQGLGGEGFCLHGMVAITMMLALDSCRQRVHMVKALVLGLREGCRVGEK